MLSKFDRRKKVVNFVQPPSESKLKVLQERNARLF